MKVQLRQRVHELEAALSRKPPTESNATSAATTSTNGKDENRMQKLQVELAESRDQIRALTSRNTDSEDEVAQLKLTIAGLQAQITNDDGSGKMSDPERDALVAGKKAAEERIGHLERQVRIDTEALKVELAESRDQIRALTSRVTIAEPR